MKAFQFLLRISWQPILIASILGAISGGSNAKLISMVNAAIRDGGTTSPLLFAGLLFFSLTIGAFSQIVLIKLSQRAIYELRMQLSCGILSSSLRHVEQLGDHRILAALTEDIRSLSHTVSIIPKICVDLSTIIGCLAYLAWLSGDIFVLLVIVLLVTVWGIQQLSRQARRLLFIAREENDQLFNHFRTMTAGTKELKLNAMRREDFLDRDLQRSAACLQAKNTNAMNMFAIADGVSQFSMFAILGIVLFLLPQFMPVSAALLASYALTVMYLTMPLKGLQRTLPDLIMANVALRKMEHMKLSLLAQAEKTTFRCRQPPMAMQAELSLEQVSYHYSVENPLENPSENSLEAPSKRTPKGQSMETPGRLLHRGGSGPHAGPHAGPHTGPHAGPRSWRPNEGHQGPPQDRLSTHHRPELSEQGFHLGPLSLSLVPGQITYLIGGNGSGKSTVAKLISGLYVPDSGSVLLNGELINDDNREWYRQHFSAIFSDFYLFDRCLKIDRGNLDREVETYLRQLKLDHKVKIHQGVLSTTQLSQGQRKRLALLTAYLEDRPVYIFDEWAADQEPAFRELFYTQILNSLKARGKTVLVITHDDRYFHLADQLLKLDYGQVQIDRVPASV